MKSLKEYLTENKKIYNFIVKIAGAINDDFEDKLKLNLEKYKLVNFEKVTTTPIQKEPIDFPNQSNTEVSVYRISVDYPAIPTEISNIISQLGIHDAQIRVHTESNPNLDYDTNKHITDRKDKKATALLNDDKYTEMPKVQHKEYYGNDHITGFLKDLSAIAKKRKSENPEITEYKLPKTKADKQGVKSAIGGKNGFSQTTE